MLTAWSRLDSTIVTPFVRLDITSSDPLPILLVQVKALTMALCTPLTVGVAVQVRVKRLWGEIFNTRVPSVGTLTIIAGSKLKDKNQDMQ